MADPAQTSELIAAIEGEHAGSDVGVRLEAALRLAASLRAVGDGVVNHYVHAARSEGRSWADIGHVLGISKQGAQKRFSAPMAARVEPWPRAFGADAQAVFAKAVDEASALGHRHVGTEHVLLALFSDRAGLAATCLAGMSLSRESVEQRVIELIGRGARAPDSSLGISPRTKRVFEAARRDSPRLGHRCPQPEDLLLALYAARDGVAAKILAGFGASEERARETLADLLGGQAPELAERIRQARRRRLRLR